MKFEKTLGLKNISPSNRYDSFNLKNKIIGQQNLSLKLNNKTATIHNYQHNKEDSNLGKLKQNNWM